MHIPAQCPCQAKAYTPRAYEAERPCCAGCLFLLWPCETVNSVSMKLIGLDVHTNTNSPPHFPARAQLKCIALYLPNVTACLTQVSPRG
ncbi:MAG: hypothetical protein ACK55Z_25650, partial [bacterium]